MALHDNAVIKAVAVRTSGNSRVFVDSVSFNKATSQPVTLVNAPNKRYEAKGGQTLVDGKFGTSGYGNGDWVGFNGDDMVAVIDLGSEQQVSEVVIRSCVTTGDWVFDATGMEIEVSNDGKTFVKVASESYPVPTAHTSGIMRHALSFPATEARYVKVTAGTLKVIPDWHPGKGKPGFLFVDEIEVN